MNEKMSQRLIIWRIRGSERKEERKNSDMRKRGKVSREERRESRKHVGRRETLEGGLSESHGLATVHKSSDLCRVKASPTVLNMCDPCKHNFHIQI
jgi:hypothetical protein